MTKVTHYRDYSKYAKRMTLPAGELVGSKVTWCCHNPEPGDIVRVATSPDRITWVDVPTNGGPAPGIRQGHKNVWSRVMVRRLATCDVDPVMDLHVKVDVDVAGSGR